MFLLSELLRQRAYFYPHPYLCFVHHDNPPCGLPKGKTNNVGLFGRDFPLQTDLLIATVFTSSRSPFSHILRIC